MILLSSVALSQILEFRNQSKKKKEIVGSKQPKKLNEIDSISKKIQIFMLLLGWYENSKSFNTENVVTMIDCELSLEI